MKYLVLAAVLLGFCHNVQAQDTSASSTDPIMVIDNSADKTQRPSVFLQEKGIPFPECENPRLQELVQQNLMIYEMKRPQRSVDERRTQALNSKNTAGFKAMPIRGFKPEKNHEVANRIIGLKLNNLISEEDMRLCFQDNRVSGRTVYLLLYHNGEGIRGEIIGYLPRNVVNSILYFDYK